MATHPALQAFPSLAFAAMEDGGTATSPTAADGAKLSLEQVLPLLQGQTTPDGESIVYHPCLSDAYEEHIQVPQVVASAAAATTDTFDATPQQKHLVVRGYPQGHASCAALVRTLFPKDVPCPSAPLCSFGGHFALPLPSMFGAGDLTRPESQQQAHVYAFSYFYDRTLEVFDLEEEHLNPMAPMHSTTTTSSSDQPQQQAQPDQQQDAESERVGAVLRVGRIRALAEQVCAFSSRRGSVRSAAEIEAEKDAAARTVLLQDNLAARRRAGCKSVSVKARDGSVRTVVLTEQDAAQLESETPAAASPAPSPSLAPLLLQEDDAASCMVEERPDLSASAEEARASVPDSLADLLQTNPHLCLDLTYLHTLLHYGYDLPEHTELHIFKKIARKEIGWCLGAMLAQMAKRGW